jgi:hypothetical protein
MPSANYKLESSQTTSVVFPQLMNNGGITVGLYSHRSGLGPKPFPPNVEVYLHADQQVVRGHDTAVPIPSNDPSMCQSYTVRLPSGEHAEIGQAKLRTSHDAATSLDGQRYHDFRVFPPWLSVDSKVTLEDDGAMVQGYLAFDAHQRWCFKQRARNGKVITFAPLADLPLS